MKRKYMLVALAFLCITFMSCGNKVEYMYKTINDNTEVMILGLVDTEGVTSLVIPSEIGGLPVTAIEMGAFADLEELKSVKLPSTLDTIGIASFSGCTSLAEIEFNEGLKKIDGHAFYGCTAIKRLELPESVTELGAYAFKGCTSLKHIESMGSIKEIFKGTFMDCTSLEKIKYPQELSKISIQAFSGCTSIKELINLPEMLTAIYSNAFENCLGLTAIEIPAGVDNISPDAFAGSFNIQTIKVSDNNRFFTSKDINGNEMNVLIDTEDEWRLLEVGAAMPMPEGVDFAIPEGAKTAFEHAFDTCKGAKSIKLPQSYAWSSTLVIFNYLPEITTVHGKAGSPAEAAVKMMKRTFVATE